MRRRADNQPERVWGRPMVLLVSSSLARSGPNSSIFPRGARFNSRHDRGGGGEAGDPDGPSGIRPERFPEDRAGYWPEKEWDARGGRPSPGDAGARFAAAWWALENGLTPQAEALLREAHAADPKHQPTARLVAMLDRLNQPCTDPDLEPLRGALGLELRGGA